MKALYQWIVRLFTSCRAPSWTPVSQGLPDDSMLVQIAMNDDDVWVGYRDGDIWRYVDAMPITSERVTHWTPMAAHPTAP